MPEVTRRSVKANIVVPQALENENRIRYMSETPNFLTYEFDFWEYNMCSPFCLCIKVSKRLLKGKPVDELRLADIPLKAEWFFRKTYPPPRLYTYLQRFNKIPYVTTLVISDYAKTTDCLTLHYSRCSEKSGFLIPSSPRSHLFFPVGTTFQEHLPFFAFLERGDKLKKCEPPCSIEKCPCIKFIQQANYILDFDIELPLWCEYMTEKILDSYFIHLAKRIYRRFNDPFCPFYIAFERMDKGHCYETVSALLEELRRENCIDRFPERLRPAFGRFITLLSLYTAS